MSTTWPTVEPGGSSSPDGPGEAGSPGEASPRRASPGRIAVVGGGSIGVAWAIVFARAGHPVSVYDDDPGRLVAVPAEIHSRVADLAANGLLPAGSGDALAARVRIATGLGDALDGAIHVQECVLESLDLKRSVFAELDGLCGPGTVLASSSSMIPCSRFAADLPGRGRCLVVHPGNPPYLLPVAEVVPAPFTDPAVVQRTNALLSSVGMTPIGVCREVEGFVFNRLQGAVLREAYCLVRDGVAGVADIDAVMRLGLGRRWGVLGPFATADLNTRGGIERHAATMGPAYARMGAERGQDDPWTAELVARVAAELHELQPLSQWERNVKHRDHALMGAVGGLRQVSPSTAGAPTARGDQAGSGDPAIADELRKMRTGRQREDDLAAAWSRLVPAGLEDLMGTWRGGLFDTGHSHNRRADAPDWYGKRITSVDDAWPDLVIEDGEIRATDSHGSLALLEFRGELTASLLYDTQPVMDHFKKVDDGNLLGVMDRRIDREEGSFLYFWLERVGVSGEIPGLPT